MNSAYKFEIDKAQLKVFVAAAEYDKAFDILTTPLHEWLYEKQDFEALDSRSTLEQLILGFDYIKMQVGQGGFIQFLQNGYAPLLPMVIEKAHELKMQSAMIKVLDDALKVYVLNINVLAKETNVEEFGKLYEEFKEFEALEKEFEALSSGFEKEICEKIIVRIAD